VAGRDGRGNTPLHYAAGYGRTAIVTLLLARGADAGAANDAGQTPVDVAGVNGEREVVAALRGAGKEEEVFVR
jgi:ankyrin repeat protein